MNKFCFSCAVAAMTLASAAGAAKAEHVTLEEINLGWFDETGQRQLGNTDILIATIKDDFQHRSFFLFDNSALNGVITGGSFSVVADADCNDAAGGCLRIETGSEVIKFYDATAEALAPRSANGNRNGAAESEIARESANDEPRTGARVNDSATPGVSSLLSDEVIEDLTNAILAGETNFAIGEAMARRSRGETAVEGFRASSANRLAERVAERVAGPQNGVGAELPSSVPLPAALPLLAAAFGGLRFAAKRKKPG